MKKILALVLSIMMVLSLTLAQAETVAELPRNETLYFAGQQWGSVNNWNALSSDSNNAMALSSSASGSRTIMYETLYMYNFLDGSMVPLLAGAAPVWNEAGTEITVKLNPAAKWSDGTAVTVDDVVYTWDSAVRLETGLGVGYVPFIDAIEAVDETSVVIKAKLSDDGKAVNPLQLTCFLGQAYIVQKAWGEALEAELNNDASEIKKAVAQDAPYTGPYGPYFADDQKVVFVRNDSYWGQDASMWGKLPVPKYIAHAANFADNAAAEVALKAGEVDVAQLFIANVQDLWLKDGLPISTYMDEAPWGICVNMPTAWFNMNVPGLDNVAVRKAIAMAVDYDAINQNAMTGQSPTFAEVPRSIMNPTPGEQATFDHDAVKDLQWVGNDIEGAKAILDEAGIVDSDSDGWRELDGKKLSFNACCPNGWSDWQAAMEIVAAAGKNIGIEITTEFPEWSVYQTIVTGAGQTDYEIFMMWTDSATPAQPWGRMRMLMSSEFIGIEGNWNGNWGNYSNARVDELIKLIPGTTDAAELKALYTEAVQIYLTDVPSFSLMYRPDKFHTVNETIWTNYPDATDGRNIPPSDCTDGYGIAALYDLELVNP